MEPTTRCGLVAVVGKPNVGKSTLVNFIIGQKVSIVSRKPQTTRRNIVGIAHLDSAQIVFVDTPGIHPTHTRLDRTMVDAAKASLDGVDVILAVVDGSKHPGEQDREVAQFVHVQRGSKPTVVCLNKMDQLAADRVVGHVGLYCELFETETYMLTQANRGRNLDKLTSILVDLLPEQEFLYPDDEFTTQSSRFMVAELVRERILNLTKQEVPYASAVTVDSWEDGQDICRIEATILVEKASQRGILIGKGGQFLRQIGESARIEAEQLLGKRIYLGLHIRVQESWRMNPRILHELEYGESS